MNVYTISTDPERLDVGLVHRWLAEESYWARGIPREVMEAAIRGSINVGAYDGDTQVGYARVVTDRATFAWICDVFVLPDHRGRGLSRRLMEAVLSHPELQGLRRWLLATRDAGGLYEKLGFRDVEARFMEIRADYLRR